MSQQGWQGQSLEEVFEADIAKLRKLAQELSNTPVVGNAPIGAPPEIKINKNDFDQLAKDIEIAIDRVPSYIVESLRVALDGSISASWGWISGSRDIVDTGQLKNSLSITTSGNKISIVYDAPYAGLVHYGGYVRPYGNPYAEPVYLPGRPWVGAVLGLNTGPVPALDFAALAEKAFKVS